MINDEALHQIQIQYKELLEQMQEIARTVARRRKVPSSRVRELHAYVAASHRNALCPCCELVPVVSDDAELLGEIDHWYHVSRGDAEETWPVCRKCNLRLTQPSFKATKGSHFQAYQFSLRTVMMLQDNQFNLFAYQEVA